MLEWIDVYVIQTSLDIGFVATGVLVEATLPDPEFSFSSSTRREISLTTAIRNPDLTEPTFEDSPAGRVSNVATRKFPDRVKMIRQQNDPGNFERISATDIANRLTQAGPPQPRRQDGTPFMRYDREKEDAACL